MAIDFDRPLGIKYRHGRRVSKLRILCRDRMSPGGYSVIGLEYDPNVAFGPEEFVVVMNENGNVASVGANRDGSKYVIVYRDTGEAV